MHQLHTLNNIKQFFVKINFSFLQMQAQTLLNLLIAILLTNLHLTGLNITPSVAQFSKKIINFLMI